MAKLKEGSTVKDKKIVVTDKDKNIAITSGTSEPAGGSDGDIYFQYEE